MKNKIQAMLQEGMVHFQAGQLQKSEAVFQGVLKIDPRNINALQLLGVIYSRVGRLLEGERMFRKAIKNNDKIPQLYYNLGNNLDTQGKLAEAIEIFRSAVKLEPANEWHHSGLGLAYLKLNRVNEALATLRHALEINPNNPTVLSNLANALWRDGKENEAAAMAERALSINPRSVDALALLGGFDLFKGEAAKAEERLRFALTLDPNHFESLNNLAVFLLSRAVPDDSKEALTICGRLVKQSPKSPDAHFNLGRALQETDNDIEAISAFRKVIQLHPSHVEALAGLATSLIFLGQFDEAHRLLQQAKTIDPSLPDIYTGLLQTSKSDLPETDIRMIEQLLDLPGSKSRQIKNLPFEYAKYLEKRGEYVKGFGYLAMGNRLKRKNYEYSTEEDRVLFDRIKSVFNYEHFEQREGTGIEDETPIFIIGMPRSGTTLIEQIISSHSQVYGAGELPDLSLLITGKCKSDLGHKYPDPVTQFTNSDFSELSNQYLCALRDKSADSKYITDKMPHNFLYLGMIWLMLPRAKVIHCRRNPIDTCLSIFKQDFRSLHKYAYDLEELGEYYLLYRDLMEHWRKVLPEGFVHEVNYEDMIADQEGISRRLVQFCGLPWEEGCLQFHTSARTVKTASVTQVRKKIYRDSVDLWRLYGNQLDPLIRILGEADQSTCTI